MKQNSSFKQQVSAPANPVASGADPGLPAVKVFEKRIESLAEVQARTRDRVQTRLQAHPDSEIDAPRVSRKCVKIIGAKTVRPLDKQDLWLVPLDSYVSPLADAAMPFLDHVGDWGNSVQRDFLDSVRREIISGQESIKLRRLDPNRISLVTGVPVQFSERLRVAIGKLVGLAGTKSKRDHH